MPAEKTYRQTVRDCCGADYCTVETFMKGNGGPPCYTNWTREVAGYYQYNLYDTCNHTGGFDLSHRSPRRSTTGSDADRSSESEAYRRVSSQAFRQVLVTHRHAPRDCLCPKNRG